MTPKAPSFWIYILAFCVGWTFAALWPDPAKTITVPVDQYEALQVARDYYFEKATELEDEIKDLNWELSQRPLPTHQP